MVERRNFKEHLIEGVRGRYFVTSRSYPYKGPRTIRIVDLRTGRGSGAVHYQLPDGKINSMNFESAYELREATPKQIESFREKESRLAQES